MLAPAVEDCYVAPALTTTLIYRYGGRVESTLMRRAVDNLDLQCLPTARSVP